MEVTYTTRRKVVALPQLIYNAIDRCQKERGLTFRAICKEIGMSTTNLYRIRDGLNESISIEQLLNIERVLLKDEDYPSNWNFEAGASLLVMKGALLETDLATAN